MQSECTVCHGQLTFYDCGTVCRTCGIHTELVADNLDSLATEIAEWNVKTFGPLGDMTGKAHHLAKEANEILDDPNKIEEWVDAFFFIAVAAHAFPHYKQAIRAKLEKNRRRVWQAPDEHGTVEHVRGIED